MEGISDRETNYQRETLTREIGRYLTHSQTLILTLLSLELQKWLCSQNWSEFNQKSISVSQKSLSCLRPMFASSRLCATMSSYGATAKLPFGQDPENIEEIKMFL